MDVKIPTFLIANEKMKEWKNGKGWWAVANFC